MTVIPRLTLFVKSIPPYCAGIAGYISIGMPMEARWLVSSIRGSLGRTILRAGSGFSKQFIRKPSPNFDEEILDM